jgi:hypothetical protein
MVGISASLHPSHVCLMLFFVHPTRIKVKVGVIVLKLVMLRPFVGLTVLVVLLADFGNVQRIVRKVHALLVGN